MTEAPDDARAAADPAIEVTPLQVAMLDAEMLEQVFFDVGAAAELLEVAIKGGAETRGAVGGVGLEEARDALVSGTAVGVKLRYRYRGTEWWDTLVRVEGGVRLVRREVGM